MTITSCPINKRSLENYYGREITEMVIKQIPADFKMLNKYIDTNEIDKFNSELFQLIQEKSDLEYE